MLCRRAKTNPITKRLYMTLTHSLNSLAGAICAVILATPAYAGTLITTNLPSGTSIVNIDARADGAADYHLDPLQSFWYKPINGVELSLMPGTYEFRVINPSDAASLYPNLSPAQLSQIYTAWTYNLPWLTNYLVFNKTASTNSSEFQLFDGAVAPGLTGNTFSSATAAYEGIIANGYYNQIRPAPPGRAGTAADYLTQWTFTEPTTALFVIPDYLLSDNTGGVSVAVTSVANSKSVPEPEPSAPALITGGIIAILLRMFRPC